MSQSKQKTSLLQLLKIHIRKKKKKKNPLALVALTKYIVWNIFGNATKQDRLLENFWLDVDYYILLQIQGLQVYNNSFLLKTFGGRWAV